jgi:hypothetical protein
MVKPFIHFLLGLSRLSSIAGGITRSSNCRPAPIQRGDERRKLRLLDILDLVDEQHQRGAGALRRPSCLFEEGCQVAVELSVIGKPSHRGQIEAN